MTKTMDSDGRKLKFKPWFCQDENLGWHWVSHLTPLSLDVLISMSHSPKVTHKVWEGKPDDSCKDLGTVSGTFQDDLKCFLLPKKTMSSSGQGTVVRETVCTQEWEDISHKHDFTWKRSPIKLRKHGTLMCTCPILSTGKLLLFVQHWTRLYEVHKKKLRSIILYLKLCNMVYNKPPKWTVQAQLGTSGHTYIGRMDSQAQGLDMNLDSFPLFIPLYPTCHLVQFLSHNDLISIHSILFMGGGPLPF